VRLRDKPLERNLLIAITLFSVAAAANADTFALIPSRAAQDPTDIIDWTQLGPDPTQLTTPQLVSSFNGNLAQIGNVNGSDFLRVDEGASWPGDFDFGESLLWTGNLNFAAGGLGPLIIVLQNPVLSFGFGIQAEWPGAFTAKVEALDVNGSALFGATFNGFSNNLENGSAQFIGLADTTGRNVSQILISTDSGASNPLFANDFAINDISFTVPETGSIILLGGALLCMAGAFRRKVRN